MKYDTAFSYLGLDLKENKNRISLDHQFYEDY